MSSDNDDDDKTAAAAATSACSSSSSNGQRKRQMRSPFSSRKTQDATSAAGRDAARVAVDPLHGECVPLYSDDSTPTAVTTSSGRCETSLSRKMSDAWRRVRHASRRRVRVLIFALTWLQLGSVLNCVDVFSFAMVYMEPGGNATTSSASESLPTTYTMEEKSTLISAMAIGSLLGMHPQNRLMQAYGARPVLATAGMLCAITTALLPWALDKSLYVALVFRIIQGVLYSADFGVVGYVCSKWSPLNEVGLSLAVLSGFTACRAVIQLPLAGWIIGYYGWRSIYYVMSVILVLVTILWYCIYRDHPEDYQMVTSGELAIIQHGKKKESAKLRVPYKKIFMDKHVWAVWLAGFADIFASFVFLVFGAQYYHYLGLDVQANAWFNSFKGLLFLVVRFLVGWGSDKITRLRENTKLRLCNTVALQIPAVFLLILGFLPRELPMLHVLCITVFQALFGFNCGGFYKGGALISRQFSYVVIGQVQLFKSLAVLIEPIVFTLLVTTDSSGKEASSWTAYFALHAVVLTVANTLFLTLARSEPAEFVVAADDDFSQMKLEKAGKMPVTATA